MDIKTTPKRLLTYNFESAPEVPVFVNELGHISVAGRTLATNHDALRLVHALIEAYRYSQETWRYPDGYGA
jgi:hypothetical protein